MSHCRFSSDKFRSDVYVFEHCHGFYQIHVASRRHVFDRDQVPDEPKDGDPDFGEKYAEHHRKLMDATKDAELEEIGLPYDGESFAADTPDETLSILQRIEDAGYNVPQKAIDRLQEEKEKGHMPKDYTEEQ